MRIFFAKSSVATIMIDGTLIYYDGFDFPRARCAPEASGRRGPLC